MIWGQPCIHLESERHLGELAMPRNNITSSGTHRGLPINCSEGRPCRIDILDRLHDQRAAALATNERTMQVRFDPRFPEDMDVPPGNRHIERFAESLQRSLVRSGCRPHYAWVREQSDGAPHQHYHCNLVVDADRSGSAKSLLKRADRMWAATVGRHGTRGLVDFCNRSADGSQRNGIIIDRNSEDAPRAIGDCAHQSSYLAKTWTKGNAPEGVRECGFSRVVPPTSPSL